MYLLLPCRHLLQMSFEVAFLFGLFPIELQSSFRLLLIQYVLETILVC